MPITRPSKEEIYARVKADMESRVTKDVKIPRYSLLGILAAVITGVSHLMYGFLTYLAEQLIISGTSDTWFLDRFAALLNMSRKAATFSSGYVKFTGTGGTTVETGVALQNSDGLQYVTIEEGIIVTGPQGVELAVIASSSGEEYNMSTGELSTVYPIDNIDTDVTLVGSIFGGQDRELNAGLFRRIVQRLSNPPSTGKASDYERMALQITGVGHAWVFRAEEYAGAGTVGVVIGSEAKGIVPPAVKAETQAYINAEKVEGAQVDVLDVDPVLVGYDVSLYPNTTETIESARQKLEELHLNEAYPGRKLRISHIRDALASSGVIDYLITGIVVDGYPVEIADLEMNGTKLPLFGTLSTDDMEP